MPSRFAPGPRSAFSLLEITLALAFLSVAGGAVMSAIVSNMMTGRVNRESALAHEAARAHMERLQERPFREIFAAFNADPEDDPGGAGTAPGADFAVPGLSARADDADGLPGRIELPASPGPGGTQLLREDLADASFGMPRDLDLDRHLDALDHAADYEVLPVRVRIEWRGVSGLRAVEAETLLANY
jgi:type II secretory pathway pseudopilin PulG